MNIHLQKADIEDIPTLTGICRAAASSPGSTWDDDYPNAEILTEDVQSGALFKIMADGETAGLLMLGEGGELSVLDDPSDGAAPFDFARFGVHPRYQGMGIGSRALALALDYARACGATCVRIIVRPTNPPARAVYRKAGFEEIHPVHLWERDYLYIRKMLTDSTEKPCTDA